jgi:hypothetical protein
MVIRMRQNAQVVEPSFDTVPREIRLIPAESARNPSSEHWQVAHPETSAHRARRLCVVIASLSCALLFAACNIYDPSLLEHNALGAGASDDGGVVDVAGAGGVFNAAGTAPFGGSLDTAGSSTIDNGGAGGGQTSGVGASSAVGGTAAAAGGAGAGGGAGGSSGINGAAGSVALAGAGGSGEVGGSAAGGALNASISMIDDMEMPDQYIPSTDGRQGFWSLSNDGTMGVQTPSIMVMSMIPGGRGASMYALHTTATGFTKTGALVGVDLNRKTMRLTYDATAYVAVHFWAMVGPGSATAVHFAMPDEHTDPGGGLCDKTPNGGQCYDHFAKDLTFTTAWAEYTVQFTDLEQYGWGANNVTALDVAQVFGIQFSYGTPTMDLWIDDISFIKK